jgi:hypothetical protein
MIVLVMSTLTVGLVFSASLLLMNTANAQSYDNSTTEQPQQQKYGAVIVFPIEPQEPKSQKTLGEWSADVLQIYRNSSGNMSEFMEGYSVYNNN